jgi:hypothetical protein
MGTQELANLLELLLGNPLDAVWKRLVRLELE